MAALSMADDRAAGACHDSSIAGVFTFDRYLAEALDEIVMHHQLLAWILMNAAAAITKAAAELANLATASGSPVQRRSRLRPRCKLICRLSADCEALDTSFAFREHAAGRWQPSCMVAPRRSFGTRDRNQRALALLPLMSA